MLSRRAFLERGSLAVGRGGHEPARSACGRGPDRPLGQADRPAALHRARGCGEGPAGNAAADCRHRLSRSRTRRRSPPRPATELRKLLNDLRPHRAEHAREHGGSADGAAAAHRLRKGARRPIPGVLVSVDGRLALSRRRAARVSHRRRHHARRLEVECGAAEHASARSLRKAGLRCGYHNHNMEFRSYDGVVGLRRTAAPDRSEARHDGTGHRAGSSRPASIRCTI